MRRRLAIATLAVALTAIGSAALSAPVEASSVRERIMAKRAALGWDCSGGDCSLRSGRRTPSTQQAAAPEPAAAPTAAAPAPAPSGGPRRIEISIAQQQLRLMEGNDVLLSTSVSTGAPSTATPSGTFSILSKERMHWSTQYDVWMPYAMRIVAGVFIHEVAVSPDGRRLGASEIGGPASHGCIRVPVGTAANLYDLSRVGMPVYVR
jgi:lipoprotein-anchoring transpeptidase ErfK/SrfK